MKPFLSVCNKRLLSATARHESHAGKRPSEQFAVRFFAGYLKTKPVKFTQELNLLH